MSAERGGGGGGDNGSDVVVARSLFPPTFVFGTATAAYQVEGAATEGGRGPSTWDAFAHEPGNVVNGDTGDVACDQYHRYEEDVGLMADMGIDAYRFSISWSRILPAGKGEVNEEGVAYYDRLIDALLTKGITPYVTLFHWDTPLALEKEFGGWLSSQIVPCFAEYAALCFSRFGDRVKHWITLNEPQCFCTCAYSLGIHAPGRSTVRPPPTLPTRPAGTSTPNMTGAAAAAAKAAAAPEPGLSRQGDSAREPYIVGHNMLRAHAAAVRMYRERFQARQRGSIGITLDAEWAEPLSDSEDDRAAAQRRMEFQLGWLLDPLLLGRDYPQAMRERVRSRLPTFAEGELGRELRGSADFVGLNHYTSKWVAHDGGRDADLLDGTAEPTDMFADQGVVITAEKDGVPIGRRAASEWLYEVPWGLLKLLLWITERYGCPPIIITENGMDEQDNPSKTLSENLNDEGRIRFYCGYLRSVADAIRDGADLRGYFAWSFMDNFEWREGYSRRFGLHYVDYDNACARHPKASARWWAEFLQKVGGAATQGCGRDNSLCHQPLSGGT